MKTQTTRKQESGNALFLILIAVALFAALSYAVTQSGRGGGSIDREQGLISASQITQFPAAVRTGVTRMVITGTAVTDLGFDTACTSSCDAEVFHTSGGGVLYQDPPANIGTATVWTFKDAQHATNGFYVEDVGLNDDVAGREILAILNGVSQNICQQIMKGLGLSSTIVAETTAVDLSATGAATYDNTASNAFEAQTGEPFACVRNGAAGNYVYYHAMVEQ